QIRISKQFCNVVNHIYQYEMIFYPVLFNGILGVDKFFPMSKHHEFQFGSRLMRYDIICNIHKETWQFLRSKPSDKRDNSCISRYSKSLFKTPLSPFGGSIF